MPLQLTTRPDGIILKIKIVPNSSRDRIAGEYSDGIKINIAKPAEAGAANKAIVALLAKTLGVPATNIEIIRGRTNARKEVLICNVSAETIHAKLLDHGG